MVPFNFVGACAEYMIALEKYCAKKPDNLTYVEAAGLPLCLLTSWQALVKHGRIKEGDKVLIIGGSGGTGHLGCQIAKAYNAHVTCIASDLEFIKKLGKNVDRMINYKEVNWSEELKDSQFDFIYDTVGGQSYWIESCHKNIIKPNGIYLTLQGDAKEEVMSVLGLIDTGLTLRRYYSRKRTQIFLDAFAGSIVKK